MIFREKKIQWETSTPSFLENKDGKTSLQSLLAIYWYPTIVFHWLWLLENLFSLQQVVNFPFDKKEENLLVVDFLHGSIEEDGDSIGKLDLLRGPTHGLPQMSCWGNFSTASGNSILSKWKFMSLIASNIILIRALKLKINTISNYTFSHSANTRACSHFSP